MQGARPAGGTGSLARRRFVRAAARLFVFASGAAALVYQVLWLKDLGVLFGNTAQASAVGLGVFFAGLATGAHVWGSRSARLRRPLAAYGWLELGIVATAAIAIGLLDAYRLVLAPLIDRAGSAPIVFLMAKTLLAVAVLFPPAFLMGGTIPVLGEAAIKGRRLGRSGALFYGLNTIGAACGALAAGFFLPVALGFDGAYLAALSVNALIGLSALLIATRLSAGSRTTAPAPLPGPDRRSGTARAPGRDTSRLPSRLILLAAGSGFCMLALEVAAMRLFAQVLQNSVYTFAAVLTVFLLALGAGALGASRLARTRLDPFVTLAALVSMSGIAIATIPSVAHLATDGLAYVASGEGWRGYLAAVVGTVSLVIGLPCAIAGTVFPFLLRLAQENSRGAGRALGSLGASNLWGAIAGSLLTGFVLLPALGLWGVFTLIAAVYLAAAFVLFAAAAPAAHPALRAAPVAGALLLVTLLAPTRLPILRLAEGEQVLYVSESAYGVTAVVERAGDRRIRVNNHYALGGSGAAEYERNQALIPLMTHPDPRSIFFLGMGTGITAGAALLPPVRRVVVSELIPDVVDAARQHFREPANGLFDDPRVTIVATDGRSHLAGTRDRYDLIVSDLFVPWEAGTGGLYTREHFATVRDRLAPRGRFVQWLPLYQMSRHEFMVVARTMLDVFSDVVVWRGDFLAERPIVALAASMEPAPIDPDVISTRAREMAGGADLPPETIPAAILPFYAGYLSRARHLVPDGPLNTDNRPVLEYAAPVTHRQQRVGEASWFVGAELLGFFEDLLRAVPPDEDPLLAQVPPSDRDWVREGLRRYAEAASRNSDY